jgi:hypothetical protein
MISMVYENDIKNASVLLNAKNVMMNFLYKVKNDKNINYFLANIYDLSNKYEELEHMEKYYFRDNVKDTLKVLHHLFIGFREINYIKEKSAKDMIKPCIVLSDHNGESLIRYISYIPILKLLNEKKEYEELIKEKMDFDSEKKHFFDYESEQKRKIFGSGFGTVKFPKDSDLTNYRLKNEHIEFREKEYKESRKEEISESISKIIEQYSILENKKDFYVTVGSIYWDKANDDNNEMIKGFTDILLLLSKKIDTKRENI